MAKVTRNCLFEKDDDKWLEREARRQSRETGERVSVAAVVRQAVRLFRIVGQDGE